jgi:hypothetical protein
MQFFIIALVFNQKNQILGVKKEVPKSFLELCGIDYDPGPIWFAPSGNQVGLFNTKEMLKTILPEISSKWPETLKKVLDISN